MANTITCGNHISKEEIQLLILWGIFSIIESPLKPNLLTNFEDFQIVFLKLQNFYSPKMWENMEKVMALIPGPFVCFVEVFELDYELFVQSKKCTVNSISVPTSARRELNVPTQMQQRVANNLFHLYSQKFSIVISRASRNFQILYSRNFQTLYYRNFQELEMN